MARLDLGRLASGALGWLAPRCCAACDGPLGAASVFCAGCHTAAPAFRGVADELLVCAAGPYEPPLSRAVQRLKYGGRSDLAVQLAELVVGAAADQERLGALRQPLLVPVPLHPLKLAARGFNQSALIGRVVARRLGLPWAPLALERIRHTAAQAGQQRSERLAQLGGAFRVRDPARIAGRDVVLIDDVFTTGATARACSEALQACGASLGCVLAVARTA